MVCNFGNANLVAVGRDLPYYLKNDRDHNLWQANQFIN